MSLTTVPEFLSTEEPEVRLSVRLRYSASKRPFALGVGEVSPGVRLIKFKPGIFSKCLRLLEIKGMECRKAQAAIQRSLSAMTMPASRKLALSFPYSLQTS